MKTNEFILKIKSLVESEIKNNGEFKIGSENVKKASLSRIHLIEPFHIDEDGNIRFIGSCEYEQKTPTNETTKKEASFEGKATLSGTSIVLDKQPITVKIR